MLSKPKYLDLLLVALLAISSTNALAADEEIQVYTDEMNEVGKFGVELHLNYVPQGSKQLSHPGEIPSNHRFQAMPEFSYGISESFEAGLYVPFAISNDGNFYATGLRPRIKYIHHPEEPSIFFWGVNTEFGYSSLKVADSMWGM